MRLREGFGDRQEKVMRGKDRERKREQERSIERNEEERKREREKKRERERKYSELKTQNFVTQGLRFWAVTYT